MKLWFLMVCCVGSVSTVSAEELGPNHSGSVGERPVCDQEVLNRHGCEVGDFGGVPAYTPELYYNSITDIRLPQIQDLQKSAKDKQKVFEPDSASDSNEMRAAWDQWHARVAEAVYQRFSLLVKASFQSVYGLNASAAYTVTKDGRIVNAHVINRSTNPLFNAIVLTAINSLNGNAALLQFPAGTKRVQVEKSGTFTQNCGPVGDFGHSPIEDFRQPKAH